ncbi:MAG: diacylglycerol kinase family protein [Oscillospiraceae bacterium]|nr:diacylglycerol kinase family protein [Oscillospiraceae bacterium]
MKKYVLYNPYAGNDGGEESAKKLDAHYIGQELVFCDVTEISDFREFFSSTSEDDDIIICGGDGTLNRFINSIDGIDIKNNILYYATGSGNDFLHDLGKPNGSEPFQINKYIEKLPYMYIGDGRCRFINGIGYGLDGHVCEMVNNSKKKKQNSYLLYAIKAILFSYRPRNATVTVDGVSKQYTNVWLSPTMKGKFFGGGMMIAPERSREKESLSVVIVHSCNKFKLLRILPTVFKGTHIRFKKYVEIHHAKEVTIEYDNPCALQVDGETVSDVKSYTARAASRAAALTK